MGADLELVRQICRKPDLILKQCGIVTGLSCTAVTTTTGTIEFRMGENGIGAQWTVTPSGETPESATWNELPAGTTYFVVTGLEPDTEYSLWMRTKCLGEYSALQSAGVRTDAPPPVTWQVILKPVMNVSPNLAAGVPNTVHFHEFEMVGAPGFINVYDLAADWPGTNEVYFLRQERLLAGDPVAMDVPTAVLPATGKNVPYHLELLTGLGYMVVWSNLEDTVPHKTIAYQDVEGNEAYYAPVVVLDNTSQALIQKLVAQVVVEEVSATSEHVVVRLTRTHAGMPFLTDFLPAVMSWLGEALDGDPDPDDPGNPDKILVTLTPGVHTVGVRTDYAAPYPPSAFTMVIEVGE